jgi:UDP-N-acetylmuramoyl-L-alanine---L-glutamate ligase
MIKIINDQLSAKKILILGFGKEGRSTYNFLRKIFPNKTLAISDKFGEHLCINEDNNLDIYSGDDYLSICGNYDVVIKSPGISLNHNIYPFDKTKITSQTDLFLKMFSCQTIGITGTKGKSTTTSLIFHTLKNADDNVILVGNIGIPPFDMIDKINSTTRIVFEMSSHQLEYVSASPAISILLNIYEEHLDHYDSYRDYQIAKFNIARYQKKENYFIYNLDNDLVNGLVKEFGVNANSYGFSAYYKPQRGTYVNDYRIMFVNKGEEIPVFSLREPIALKGLHNFKNMMAAVNVFKILGISHEIIRESFCSFKGLPHRLEYVGEYNGISYFNDSIATIPQATIAALKALNNVQTLILGGFDRGIDYSVLTDFLLNNAPPTLIFMGEAGARIHKGLMDAGFTRSEMIFADSMEDVAAISKSKTPKGGICLLSPAAASYDRFKNFEERGDLFKFHVSK